MRRMQSDISWKPFWRYRLHSNGRGRGCITLQCHAEVVRVGGRVPGIACRIKSYTVFEDPGLAQSRTDAHRGTSHGGSCFRPTAESSAAGTIDRMPDGETTVLHQDDRAVEQKILGSLSLAILGGILTAGLWPFHAPANQVAWLKHSDGIVLGRFGTLVSSDFLKPSSAAGNPSCSLEISLQPRFLNDPGQFSALYSPDRGVTFSIHQFQSDLVLPNSEEATDGGEIANDSGAVTYSEDSLGNRC